MHFATRYAGLPSLAQERKSAERLFERVAAQKSDAVGRLPEHRSLIRAIREHGMQRV
jgi:tryptophan halogenase